jgi:hypothetical protein
MSLILGAALIAALGAVAWKAWRRRAAERARPGGTPETALAVHDFAEIDRASRGQTCHCGGPFRLRGEGPAQWAGRPLRAVTLECSRCERERRLYFDLSELRH